MEDTQNVRKNVIVSVLGIQQYEDQSDSIGIIAPGQYYQKTSKHYITYKESDQNDSKEITTTIKIDGQKISVMRFGTNNSHMTFELGKKHMTYYDTPHGCFTISVLAKEIRIDLQDGEGEIYVLYELEFDNISKGTNSFQIRIQAGEHNKKIIPVQRTSSEMQIQ
jgi:uncharacterized beta-barrel protein YwiB (DUF1934 family)